MILAPRNANVANLNECILERMAGEARQYFSADKIIHEAGADPHNAEPIPIEVLRSITSSSLPPGELNLKLGCPVILLRNLDPSQGLCNGTRMVITRMGNRVLEAQLLGGEHHGETVLIPRISLIPTGATDLTFQLKRHQYPLRLAFALSINKAQGQSVKTVGIFLQTPVFAHGQLYVALSRATAADSVKVLLPSDSLGSTTQNIVYNEILIPS
jgi:ATP-dependent exoDNAse (exonuclease V) alpha subunit